MGFCHDLNSMAGYANCKANALKISFSMPPRQAIRIVHAALEASDGIEHGKPFPLHFDRLRRFLRLGCPLVQKHR